MRIAITVGHSILKNGNITSADGTKYGGVNEYKWCRAFSKQLKKALEKNGHKVDRIVCPERVFDKSTDERNYKIPLINKGNYDLLIELHLNAASPDANGTEVLYKSDRGKKYAQSVQNQLSSVFKDRGIKCKNNLYILNQTKPTAILIETYFCTNKKDYKKAKGLVKRTKLANLVAKGINNVK